MKMPNQSRMTNMLIKNLKLFVLLCAGGILWPSAFGHAGEIIEGIVAHVGSDVVLLSDVKKRVA